MLTNYAKVATRNLLKSKAYSLVNILGLAIGIGSVLLISLFSAQELSYDSHFNDSERLYRVALERIYPNRERLFASSSAVLANVLLENYPEVEEATRLHRMFFVNEIPVDIEERTFRESRFYFADKNFFRVFSHEFIHGDPETALDAPEKIVLTESIASKYFGQENPLNKIIQIDTIALKVSGVIKDTPATTHMHFDLLGHYTQVDYLVQAEETNNWINPWLYTYIKLRADVEAAEFAEKLTRVADEYGKASIAQGLGENYQEAGHAFNYFLQPVRDIHLHSNLDVEVEANGNYNNILVLLAIAGIILIISSINFINLTTARSADRAREVGIRKVMGSLRTNLVSQFLIESLIIAISGGVIGMGLVIYILPEFNNLLGTTLVIDVLFEPFILTGFICFVLLVGIVSGLYPAMAISGMQPSIVLKGSFKSSNEGVWLRNSLTIIQFFMAIVMITGAITVNRQMHYMQTKDLGFNKDNLVVIKDAYYLESNYEAFKNEVRTLPDVVSLGGAFAMPGDFIGSAVLNSPDAPEVTDFRANTITVDADFMATMKFEMAAGRTYNSENRDSLAVIVNEAAVASMNLKEPLGARIMNTSTPEGVPNPPRTIVGVVRDYNFLSLHSPITPLIINRGPDDFNAPVIGVRVEQGKAAAVVEKIEAIWSNFAEEPFAYSYLDEDLNQHYKADMTTGKIFDIFTYMAIFISCVGLFGLSTYVVQQRLKEMSIRKVLGASPIKIMLLFADYFVRLIGIAFLIGFPTAYYLSNLWLDNFAYHLEVSWIVFLLSALVLLLFVIVTISYQSIRLAKVNPIDNIRSE